MTLFSRITDIHCQFAANFKCSESKQSPEYILDVKNYVNEVSDYLGQQKMEAIDLRGIGVGFLSDWDLSWGRSNRHVKSLDLSMNVMREISFCLVLR